MLDTTVLESLLLQLPKTSQSVSEQSLNSYNKVLKSRVAQIEGVLKLLSTSSSMVVERFVSLLPDGNVADLQAVMTLKGMKKQEQTAAIEAYRGPTPLKATPFQSSNDTFPLLVSIAGVSSAVSASSSISTSMRNLTTDISFNVGPLKWSSKGST